VSGLEVPATRTLARVLRQSLAPTDDPVRLLLGTGAAPPTGTAANAYANIVLQGQTVQMPKLRGVPQPAVGAPAYVLAGKDYLLYLGSVSLTA